VHRYFLILVSLVLAMLSPARAQTVLVSQTPVSGGGVSRWSQLWQDPGPNGNDLDGDSVCWADFTLTEAATINHMEWWGIGACELGFRIEFWRQDPNTIAYQPIGVFYYGGDHSVLPQARFDTNAMTVTAGPGGINHYSLDLATPVTLAANSPSNVRWFVAIIGLTHQAYQTWNWAQGNGPGLGTYQFIRGMPFRSLGDRRAFLLRSPAGPVVTIAASASPLNAGTITGTGAYPTNTVASLRATPNAGWGFVNWTDGGVAVADTRTYTFVATVPRTLVANFVPAYTITTAAFPAYAGSVTGGGTFNAGSLVSVVATPNPGFIFTEWTSNGFFVSDQPVYEFPAGASQNLVANFVLDPLGAFFDFDNAPVHTSLPVSVSADGVTAFLSATGGGFSIQPANSLGFTPAGFGGLCIYPNSVFPADLVIDFDATLSDFSVLYSPQELGCDNSATMRATAFMNNQFVATNTATVPAPGTWPTGRLSLSAPQGFNRVVVHYDARPPTCQDWGPIFLADNMTVVRIPPPFCPADFNGDSLVNPDDLADYIACYFTQPPCPAADFNADGNIDPDDLSDYIATYFGPPC